VRLCDGAGAHHLRYSAGPKFNQPIKDFPSPGWKIAIGLFTISALATLTKRPPITFK